MVFYESVYGGGDHGFLLILCLECSWVVQTGGFYYPLVFRQAGLCGCHFEYGVVE